MDVQVGLPPPPPPPPVFFAETPAAPSPLPAAQPATTATTTTVNVTSPATQDRIWLHPWTAAEMRDHASQWSLAGDTGVLLYLEQFSDRLTQRADAIQQHLTQTVNAVKSTHTRVLNCLNEFTSLANTQFIENRVYDEDETASSTAEASKKEDPSTDKSNVNSTEAQEKVLQRYVEAIQYGLAILDTHFERVEAKLENHTNGGSSFVEDEEDPGGSQEPILEPKDPYILRPLPFLIGTTEFMQDDYVGLGDLLIVPDDDPYHVQQIANIDDDSALSSSDEGEDNDEEAFQAQVAPAAVLVPAGAPLPDLSKPPPSSNTFLSDDEDDDDPFGIGKIVTRIDPIPSKPTVNDDDLFDDEPKKPLPKTEKAFTLDSDDEENSSFGIPTKPPQTVTKRDSDNDDFDDKSSTASDKPEEPEPPKPKVMSELEKAVLRRRKQLGDPDVPVGDKYGADDDDDDDGFGIKPAKTKPKTSSNDPSSSTIFHLASQPLTAPTKTTQPSIFGEDDDDDDNDIFNPKSKPSNVLPPVMKIDPKSPQKKERDMFDDDEGDDEADIFSPTKKTSTPSSQPAAKKNDPIPTQTTVVNKPKPIVQVDVSEDDAFFGEKTKPVIPIPVANKKVESSHSDDDDDDDDDDDILTVSATKPKPSLATKIPVTIDSDDEDPLRAVKPIETKVSSTPVVPLNIKKPVPELDSSDDDMFGISKKQPASRTAAPPLPKIVPTVKSDDDDEEELSKKSKAIPTNLSKTKSLLDSDDDEEISEKTKAAPTQTRVLPTNPPKLQPLLDSDDDEKLFSKTSSTKPPSSTVSPSLPATSSTKSSISDDPLRIGRSVQPTSPSPAPVVQETKTSSVPTRKSSSTDDDEKNPGALQGDVKTIAARIQINPNAWKPSGFKPPARPKASSITEESPKPSVEDDDQPVEKNPPVLTVTKKSLTLDSDSDDDGLFGSKKKIETRKTPADEPKEKPTNANERGKSSIKDLSARLNFTPKPPGVAPIPIPKETKETTDEPVVEKTMNDLLRDKSKVAVRNRAPPSRRTPATRAAAAAASNDDGDDLFATPKPTTTTTTTTKPSSTPTAVPIVTPPSPANVPVVPPPSVPVLVVPPPSVPAPETGLPDKLAALAAKQTNSKEKKKFSLFDSDDSDIDELLFGSNTKKTKSSVTSKATTTKSTSKASALPLDDDDDFLSKRPVKKNAKPTVDGDDIFADGKSKSQSGNKPKKDWSVMAKSGGTDDIFNDASPKSSSTPKAKATNGKTKASKNFDDIFDDPLNISSKSPTTTK